MKLGVRFDTSDVRIAQFRQRAPQAIARALNRSLGSAKTVMVRVVAQDMGLRQRDVRDLIRESHAKPEHLVAQLFASFKRIPVYDFSAREERPRGVTAKLSGVRTRYPHAFIATMKSGHRGVFRRKTKARLPIKELFGPSIARVFLKHVDVGLQRGHEQLVKNLESEFRFAMRDAA
jgi:hypothetical protein